ncbi:MAG: hypothetical protein WC389_08015 [Lutibacter sp.]|jgi:hypothetical protein
MANSLRALAYVLAKSHCLNEKAVFKWLKNHHDENFHIEHAQKYRSDSDCNFLHSILNNIDYKEGEE